MIHAGFILLLSLIPPQAVPSFDEAPTKDLLLLFEPEEDELDFASEDIPAAPDSSPAVPVWNPPAEAELFPVESEPDHLDIPILDPSASQRPPADSRFVSAVQIPAEAVMVRRITNAIVGDSSPGSEGDTTVRPGLPDVFAVPDYRRNPKPAYPSLALRRRQQGTVLLSVMVTVDGRTKEVRVKQSSGFLLLDESAVRTVRDSWEFTPGRIGGIAVESEAEFPVTFRLP